MEFNKKFFKNNIKTIALMVGAIIVFAVLNIILSNNSDKSLLEKDLPIKGEGKYEDDSSGSGTPPYFPKELSCRYSHHLEPKARPSSCRLPE